MPAWLGWVLAAGEFGMVYGLAWRGPLWIVAAAVIAAVELRAVLLRDHGVGPVTALWACLPGLILGVSVTLIVALVPRHATQIGVAALYAAWLALRQLGPAEWSHRLVNTLVVQAVMLEAIFLMAAFWLQPGGSMPGWLILVLAWAGAYFGVYAALTRRGDQSAGVMAATWGVVVIEVGWVLMLWLITYTMRGGYVLVPQPALILTALAYIFGSILASSREGKLSRGRLAEYMLITFILVVIVVFGTYFRSPS